MDLEDRKATDTFRYARPARPLMYVWIFGLILFVSWMEFHAYNNASFGQFLISIPFFIFSFFLFTVGFLGAAGLEIDGESVRRSLLGWSIISIPWKDATVIQGFYVRRRGGGLVGGYRVLSRNRFFVTGVVFFTDESEVLAPKLNLIAKRFDIPLEQRLDLYGKFEKVEAIQFKSC